MPRPAGTQARPPYRAPHHSASSAALLGTVHGYRVSPGAVTLAHRGVLFMDEAPEFSRPSLEGLRQPLESGVVSINRSGWSGVLPGRFQLVLAANPCPCGLRPGTGEGCSCTPVAVRRYASRLSGPFMDRIDVRLSLQRPAAAELAGGDADSSAVVRARVAAARRRASERFAGRSWQTNAGIPAGELRREWLPDAGGIELLNSLERGSANLRGPDRVLRLAWTLADLAVALRYKGIGVGVVVVCPAGLGTLNHTALTAEALRSRSLGVLGLVVGSWPVSENEADLAMHENLADLPRIAAAPLLGRLPAGAGGWRPEDFAAAAPSWLAL